MADERQGKISASGAWILYQCSGSMRMQAGMPQEEPAPETLQGSAIAEAMASEDLAGLDDEGRTISQRLQQMIDQALMDWGRPFPRIIKEVRMWHYSEVGEPIVSAKPDFVAISGNSALIIEEKSGYLPVVPASQNVQLRIQSLCLTSEYPNITEVYGAIAHHRFMGSFTSVYYGPRELEMARKELDFKLWMSEDIDAPLNPGEWCRYCRAKSRCPSAAAFTLLPVAQVQQLEPITKENVAALVKRLTLAQMAVIRKNKSIIEKIIEAVDETLRATPLMDLQSVGLTLAKPASGRTIEDAPGAQQALVDQGLITPEEFTTCVKVVGGRVEELVVPRIQAKAKEVNEDLDAKAAKARMWQILGAVSKEYFRSAPLRTLKEKND